MIMFGDVICILYDVEEVAIGLDCDCFPIENQLRLKNITETKSNIFGTVVPIPKLQYGVNLVDMRSYRIVTTPVQPS